MNRDEDRDHAKFGIEIIDEYEFRKWKRKFVSEIGSSTCQERDEERIAGTSAKIVRRVSKKIPCSAKNDWNKKKRKASGSALKKKGGAWKKNVYLDDDDDSSSDEFLCSSWSTDSNGDDVSTSHQDSKGSSYGAEQEMVVGIADQTRTKMGSIKKALEAGSVLLGSSTGTEARS